MLDIHFVRENAGLVKNSFKKRGGKYNPKIVDELLETDGEWRKLKGEVDELRHERNDITLEIVKSRKQGKDISKIVERAKVLPAKIKDNEERLEILRKKIEEFLLSVPNILYGDVPAGEGNEENKVVKIFGSRTKFKFKPLSHVDLIEKYHFADLERAAKISGARWYFLRGELALLENALVRYGIDFMIKKKFELVIPPFMMNRKAYTGVTDLGAFGEMLYKIENEDLYTIATSEHPITAMFMDETLNEKDLPIKIVGYSTNFRKEAGSHGKDTKGIFRVHQFNKVEQLVICKPDDSWKFHEILAKNAIEFLKSLGIPFRQVLLCGGDTGVVSAKTYDLEFWSPVQKEYREIASCSNCTSYQAVRLGIKYGASDGNKYVHTLNSTLIPTSRALVAILENFQMKDGSVVVPKVLRKYMNGIKVIGKPKKEVKKKIKIKGK